MKSGSIGIKNLGSIQCLSPAKNFDWEGDGETDHVGLVERVENGTVYTVEGNSGDACRQNSYAIGSSVIYGYGVPAY